MIRLLFVLALLSSAVPAQSQVGVPLQVNLTRDGISGCPSGDDLNPPSGALRTTDFVDVENTGVFANRIRVRADGRITWRGGQISFPASFQVKPEDARNLIEAFRSPDVWRLCRYYSQGIIASKIPWTVTTIQIRGKLRRISDRDERAPKFLRDLDRRIEKLIPVVPMTLLPATPVTNAFVQLIRDPSHNISDVRHLIGRDINLVDAYGWSLLMYCTQEPSSLAQMKSILAAGALPNVRSSTGESPLMLAVSSKSFNPDWITTLIEAGADVNARNDDGQSVLMYAVNHLAIYPSKGLGNVISVLRSKGARTDTLDNNELSVFDYWDEIVKGVNSMKNYQWIDDSLRK